MYLKGYYVYAYMNEQGQPYYIGKGQKRRLVESHRVTELQFLLGIKSKY